MANAHEAPGADPDNVPEILCLGKFNLSFSAGGLATLTFTHIRPKAGPLLDSNKVEDECIVRARVVTNAENLVALRDILNSVLKDVPAANAGSVGAATLN